MPSTASGWVCFDAMGNGEVGIHLQLSVRTGLIANVRNEYLNSKPGRMEAEEKNEELQLNMKG